ncbi:hypothetical protein V8C26DRAFT_393464 [Trichoderma gracile]
MCTRLCYSPVSVGTQRRQGLGTCLLVGLVGSSGCISQAAVTGRGRWAWWYLVFSGGAVASMRPHGRLAFALVFTMRCWYWFRYVTSVFTVYWLLGPSRDR